MTITNKYMNKHIFNIPHKMNLTERHLLSKQLLPLKACVPRLTSLSIFLLKRIMV